MKTKRKVNKLRLVSLLLAISVVFNVLVVCFSSAEPVVPVPEPEYCEIVAINEQGLVIKQFDDTIKAWKYHTTLCKTLLEAGFKAGDKIEAKEVTN